MATAGRMLIIPKGDYDANATYEMLDLVNHDGKTWLAKKHSQGIVPSEDSSDHWFMVLGVAHDSTPIANNLVTTEEGFALDAPQGKALMDAIELTNEKVLGVETGLSELQTSISETQTSISETQTSISETQVSLLEMQASLDATDTALESLGDTVAQMQSNATIITGTLATGETSIVLADERITTDSMLSIYTSVWGVIPTSVAVVSGQVTLTFEAQTSAMEVGVRVDG